MAGQWSRFLRGYWRLKRRAISASPDRYGYLTMIETDVSDEAIDDTGLTTTAVEQCISDQKKVNSQLLDEALCLEFVVVSRDIGSGW